MSSLLQQRYQITDIVGRGGMGVVYKALDTQLGNRLVAIKEMQQESNNPEAIDAFKREAEMLGHLLHPHLPSIHDHFVESGRCYLVMEFIEGKTLEAYVRAKGGWLPCAEVLEIGLQLCSVLDYLHTRQPPIVFRDLKPLNIMLSSERHVYLIDFGIARHFKPGQASDTAVGYSIGYSAPEQYSLASTQTTPLSDIYSLGATFYRLLTGHNPALNQPMPFRFPPLQWHSEAASAELETLIMQMIEPVARQRPESIHHVKQRLQHIAGQQGVFLAGRRAASDPDMVSTYVVSTPEVPQLLGMTQARIDALTLPIYASSTPPIAKKRGNARRSFLIGLTTLALAGSGVVGWEVTQNLRKPTAKPTPKPIPKPPINLALNKKVSSNNSLEKAAWGADRLTDGKEKGIAGVNTGYTSNPFAAPNVSSDPPFVKIDLGSNQNFNRVRLFPRTDVLTTDGSTAGFPINFTIQVADNTSTSITVANVINQPNPQGLPQTYSFPTVSARSVTVTATMLGTPASDETSVYRMQLAEIEIFLNSALK